MNLYFNGWIIQKNKEGLYKGVEGDNWFLNYEEMIDKEIVDYFDDNIDLAWADTGLVDVANDFNYIMKCASIAKAKKIKFRIILCYTTRENPKANDENVQAEFLGYDYAYSGGSYYSAVSNDVVSKRIAIFEKFKLNSNGLFESEEDVKEFIVERNKLKQNSTDLYFEDGDFIIYKLYDLKTE